MNNYFTKLNFKESQMNAIIEIYKKYFDPLMPDKYTGNGVVALWHKDATWVPGEGTDINHRNPGIVCEECRKDLLWKEFSDLLPYMSKSATITKIPPGHVMYPHIDRKWRPEAIYFPISGCSEKCFSDYYNNYKKRDTPNSQGIRYFPKSIARYAVYKNAYLTNVHELHSVRNISNQERIALGWNFLSPDMSYKDCYEILKKLGYTDDL